MEVKPGYKQTEVGVIPEEWECTNVRGIASSARNAIVGGPFGSDLVSADYVDDGVPVIRGQNMSGQWVSGAFVFVTHKKARSLEANLARPRDIVFTQRGTLGQVSLVPEKPYVAYLVSQSQMKVSVNPGIADPLFYYYVFTSEEQQELIRGGTIQTGVPHINLGILRGIPIQRPPLPEQRAIAEALSDVDGLLGGLDRLIAKKRDLKQAAMQQLLTGQTRLPGFHGEWVVKTLGDLFTFSGGYSASRDQLSDDGHCYLHYGDIHGSSKMFTDVSAEYQDIPKLNIPLKQVASKSLLKDGDVVFVDASEDDEGTSKHIVIVNKQNIPFISGLHTIVAKSKTDELAHEYRRYCFQTSAIKQQFLFYAVGTKVSGISKTNIPKLTLPVPSVPEQTAIAAVLSDMDAELAALEQRCEKTRALKQAMMHELLTGKTRLVN
jgi:type I restriction enzyme S subunit